MIVDELKKENIRLRKAKDPAASFSTFVLAEVKKIGKNKGNRATTDEEAIQAMKKMLATSDANYEMTNDGPTHYLESHFLKQFLPKMASAGEIRGYLDMAFKGTKPSKGEVMKGLKQYFGGGVDMKLASEIAQELFWG